MVLSGDLGIPRLTLYVGDLHFEVTEAMLFEHFSRVGPLTTVRVCRDLLTKRSLGYAYVNFERHEDAANALQHLNYQCLKGRPMRIMWSERDPTQRRPNPSNIFVKNLDKDATSKDLYLLLCKYGVITSCKVHTDGEASKGFGFAQFSNPEEAREAIANTNGLMYKGKPLFVGPFVPKSQRAQHELTFRNVYVKNLPPTMEDDHLESVFSKFGSITSAKVMTGKDGKSLCHGFVCYSEHQEAVKAIEEMEGKLLEGSTAPLVVNRAQVKTERQAELKAIYEKKKLQYRRRGVNLYVKGLAATVDDEKLVEMFSPFGKITSAKVIKDSASGRSRRFGFVCFETPEEATNAIRGVNGTRGVNGDEYVVTYAQPKQERVAELQAWHIQDQQARAGPKPTLYPGGTFFLPNALARRAQMQARMNNRPQVPRLATFLPRPQNIPRAPMPYYQGQMAPQVPPAVRMVHEGLVMREPQLLTAADLAHKTKEESHQILGDRVYTAIVSRFGDRALQMTRMLLENKSVDDILGLLKHREELYAAVENLQEMLIAMEAKGAVAGR